MKTIYSFIFLLFSFVCGYAQCTDIFISEYVEGSNNNKAVEIYNPTANNINLAGNYRLVRYGNGTAAATAEADVTSYISLGTYTVTSYSTFVFILDKRDPSGVGQELPIDNALKSIGDNLSGQTPPTGAYICPVYNTNNTLYHNGNDALAIQKWNGSTWNYVDIFGVIGECPIGYSNESAMTLGSCNSPTAGWSNISPYSAPPAGYNTALPPTGQGFYFKRIYTADHSLIRKNTVQQGTSVNPAMQSWNVATQWDSLPNNTFSNLGSHTCNCYVPPSGNNQANLATLTTPSGSFVTSFTSPSYTTTSYSQTSTTTSTTYTYYVYLPYTTTYPVNLPTLNYTLVNTSAPASLTTYTAGSTLANSTSVSTTTIKVKSTDGTVTNTYRILFKVEPLMTSNEANLATLTTPSGSFVTSFTSPNYTTSSYSQTSATTSTTYTYYVYLPYTTTYPVNLPTLNYTLVNTSAPASLTTYTAGSTLANSTSVSTTTIKVKSTDGTVTNTYRVLFKVAPLITSNEANLATLTTPSGSFVTSFTSPNYTTSSYSQTSATINTTFTYYVYLPYTTSYPVNLPALSYSMVNTSAPTSLTTYTGGSSLASSTSVSTTTIKVKSTDGTVLNTYQILFKVEPEIQVAPNGTPVLLSATASSSLPNYVSIIWSDNSTNETAFLVIRNATVIATLTENVTSYIDNSVAFSTPYTYQVKASNAIGVSAASNSLSVVTMQEPIATGLIENNKNSFTVLPNPSSSVFTITFTNLSSSKSFNYRLIDITGKEVLSNKTTAANGLNSYLVDVTSMAKGIYFVECVIDNKKMHNKIVIE